MGKRFKRRDGFRGTPGYFVAGSFPYTINRTERDSRKRVVEKRPVQKKK